MRVYIENGMWLVRINGIVIKAPYNIENACDAINYGMMLVRKVIS